MFVTCTLPEIFVYLFKSGVTDLGFKLQAQEDKIKGILDIFYC